MGNNDYESWGRFPRVSHAGILNPDTIDNVKPAMASVGSSVLPRGLGRSYGDSCLNDNNFLLATQNLNLIQEFDEASGVIRCDAGVTLEQILLAGVPRGWFLPVTPGTKFVTIGGAIANDVHGKNHHRAGSFGNHVMRFHLLRSDGDVVLCGPHENAELFRATIGGLGLTGIILWAEIQLRRVASAYIDVESIRFSSLDEFVELTKASDQNYEYTVAWIDCLSSGESLGRGIFYRGNHAAERSSNNGQVRRSAKWKTVPFDAPSVLLSTPMIRAFNSLYYRKQFRKQSNALTHYDPFFYPLDSVGKWNRMYGRRGFLQWQCVVPPADGYSVIKRILGKIAGSRLGSFLGVLKEFGNKPAVGYLSFPMPGITLALDFANKGERLFRLLNELDTIVIECGGRIYPAKDARMNSEIFHASFPNFDAFTKYVDPKFSSTFYRRVSNGHLNSKTKIANSNEAMMMNKPEMLAVDDVKKMTAEETGKLFCTHMNPGQYHFLKLLGFHKVIIERAEGMYYYDKEGRQILDFFGGFGSVGFGHNHPRILAVRQKFQDERRHEIAIAFMSQYAVGLAKNLAAIAPGDLDIVFLCCSGSEAVEAALKIAERAQGSDRAKIAFAEKSFHGKSRGSLSVTDSEFYQSSFNLLSNRVRVPFGDVDALEQAFKSDPSVGILILESIQGGAGIVVPPEGYFKEVRRLCDKYNVLWIADEVQCGMGRSGRFFAFEHDEVVPDLVTLAKSLGGSKVAMGAVIARTPIYMKAYGTPKTALIHGPATFGAMGEACCTAIEGLHVLYDEGLIDNAYKQGAYLLQRLFDVKQKHPKIIKDVRGRGLMIGVEFQDISNTMPFGLKQIVSKLDDKLKGSLCGFVGSLLLSDYKVLVAFTEYNRNVIRLEPALIVRKEHVDTFVSAFDELLSRGIAKIVTDYARNSLTK
jgi:acetylornithine/succinyldiaminopimelate/putrescine aminotransferase/FAD/FMN-containing dehydrogenase